MPNDNYENLNEITQADNQVTAQYYSDIDLTALGTLTSGYMLSPIFGKSTHDRVEYHVYDPNLDRLFSNHRSENWSVDADIDGMPQANLRLKEDLDILQLVNGTYNVVYNFHRDAVGGPLGPKFKVHAVSKDRKEVRLVPTVFKDSVSEAGPELETFYDRFQQLKATSGIIGPYNDKAAIPNNPLWTNMMVNFGFDRLNTIVSWLIDDVFPYDPDQPHTILLKLYKPLSTDITVDSLCWLVAEATQPIINKIILDQPIPIEGNNISDPNFDLCLDTTARLQTGYKSYNELLGADSDVKSELQNSFSSSLDGIKLNIDYTVFENYVHFSSAESRIENFKHKLNQVSYFDSQARRFDYSDYSTSDVYIYEYTGSHGSKYTKEYQKRWVDQKVKLINEFDDFEKWLYFESGSAANYTTTSGSRGGGALDWSRSVITPFPKHSGSYKNDRWDDDYYNWSNDQLFDWAVHSIFMPGPNYELLHVTSSEASTWYDTAILSASIYDKQNQNMLRHTTPQFINDGGKDENETYLRFLDLTGQAHDLWWTYARYFNHTTNRDHNNQYINRTGLSDDIVYHVAKSYGMDLVDGDPNQDLWEYRLGKDSNGHRIKFNTTGSMKTLTSKERTSEVWKRIVNNLPFLLKTKGTEIGVRGLINCYGIPEHILPVYEYGSSKKSEQSTLYEERGFKYTLNFSSQSVSTYWGPHHGTVDTVKPVRFSVGGVDVIEAVTPNSVEFRMWPENASLASQNASFAYSQSLWQVNNDFGVVLHRSHSSAKKINGQPEGITEFGHFSLVMSGSKINTSIGDEYHTVSTPKAKIFDKNKSKQAGEGWWTLMLNRKAGSNYHSSSKFEYELVAMRAEYGAIGQAISCSLRVTASKSQGGVDSGFLSSSLNNAWSGSLQNSMKAYLGGYATSSNAVDYAESIHGKFGQQFHGSMQELRYYASPLSKDTLKAHTLAPEMYSSNNGTDTYEQLLLRLKLSDKSNNFSGSAGLNSTSASVNITSFHPNRKKQYNYWDTDQTFILSGSTHNYPNSPQYDFVEETWYIDTPELGPNNYTSDKIRHEDNNLIRQLSPSSRAEKPASEKYALDSNNLGIYFSPSDQVNKDIFDHLGGIQLDDFIGDAQQAFDDKYSELQRLNRIYFNKYDKDADKSAYLNELKLYDMSLFTMLKSYLPARANADLGVVIQPHFLERSKAASRGKMSISGDTKAQNIALNASSFVRAKAPTNISCAEPEVAQYGFALEPQTTTGTVNPAQTNALLKTFTAIPQQHIPVEINDHKPNTTTIDCKLSTSDGSPLIVLSSDPPKSAPKGSPGVVQHNASNVVSHQTNSPLADIGGTITVGNQVTGTPYSFKGLHKKADGTYIPVETPDWKQSGSLDHICAYRKSSTRMVNEYFYNGSSVSASKGKPYEDGSSVNLFAASKSLKPAEVSDFNLGGTTGLERMKYLGSQLKGAGFNIDSAATPDNGPVVSFTLGDPNQLISSDAGFGGNLSIE